MLQRKKGFTMCEKNLIDLTNRLFENAPQNDGGVTDEPSGIHCLRYEETSELCASIYHPLLCLVLQGEKVVKTSKRSFQVGAGASLIVSHTVPIASQITMASKDEPYLALVLPLDVDILRKIGSLSPTTVSHLPYDPFSLSLEETSGDLLDAFGRLLSQPNEEQVKKMLVPIIVQEIHARLLLGSHASNLRRLLWHENSESRIFQATQEIEEKLAQTVVISDLAQQVGMSNSAFFEHFKSVTGTSPLQYQKELRLLKAREHLQARKSKISEVAYLVGYESPTQFSREYTRKFGRTPKEERQIA